MKKFVKWMIILAVIFCFLGLGMISGGAMMGGGYYLEQALERADMWDGRYEKDKTKDRAFEASSETGEKKESEAQKMSGEEEQVFENIRELEIEAVGTVFYRESGEVEPGQMIIRKESDGEDYDYRQDGNTLKIDRPRTRSLGIQEEKRKTITILVPANEKMEKIEIESVGKFQAEGMQAEKISVEVKAGQTVIDRAKTDVLDLEVDAGRIECQADVAQKISAECDAGEIALNVNGKKEDFDYDLECSLGTIVLNGEKPEEYTGLRKEKNIENTGSKKMDLECRAGNITVSYQEDGQQ